MSTGEGSERSLMTQLELALTFEEKDLLAECEVVIERGMGVFIETGEALMTVRDRRLYRAEFPRFEDYCRHRWQLSVPYANQLIQAARVVDAITAIASEIDYADEPLDISIPATESQARELAPLLDDPEELREVWSETVERTEGRPTAAAIRAVREEREDQRSSLTSADVKAAATALQKASQRPLTAEQEQSLKEQVAKQEALSAWNQAHDGLVHALSYAKTWRPPADTDIYVTVERFADRAAELAAIAATWKESNGQD